VQNRRFSYVPFELGAASNPMALEGANALVHVAYDFSHTRWRDIARVNVNGSCRLFTDAREAGVERIVCISTVAAFPGARSKYGRAKLEIERMALDVGAAIVRPGLVWGPEGAAMFGSLARAVERLPIVPLVVPDDLGVTAVHEEDLALLLERLLERWPDGSGKLFVAASERTLTFGGLLRSLSAKSGHSRPLVGIPWPVAWLGLRAIEALGARPPFPSDRLLSLATTDREPLAHDTGHAERYGVEFRPYPSI
jgi:NADH dehydrogenase